MKCTQSVSRNVASVIVAVGCLAVAAPADASKYFSAEDPLNAWENGVSQGQMYGRFFKEDLTYLRNNTWTRDPRPGGDAVYEQTDYQWFHDHAIGPDYWSPWSSDQSATTDTGTWYSQYDHEAYEDGAKQGRIRTKVCERQSFSPDPCSDQPTETFDL
jgi:hypothetical protein